MLVGSTGSQDRSHDRGSEDEGVRDRAPRETRERGRERSENARDDEALVSSLWQRHLRDLSESAGRSGLCCMDVSLIAVCMALKPFCVLCTKSSNNRCTCGIRLLNDIDCQSAQDALQSALMLHELPLHIFAG